MSEADAHIQDNDILRMSVQQQHESKPLIRFAATLPSGREIHSEWLDPGKRREAIQAWLGAVRSNIVADEEDARLKARRAALEERARKDTAREEDSPTIAPSVEPAVATSIVTRPSMPAVHNSPSAPAAPSPLSTDPNVFVRLAVTTAEQTLAYWRAEAAKAVANMQEAESSLKKWRGIAQSIGVPTGNDTVSEARSPDRAVADQPSIQPAADQPSDSASAAGAVPDACTLREI